MNEQRTATPPEVANPPLAGLAETASQAARAFAALAGAMQNRPSKHRAGHAGQKAKAKARRRGAHGKAVRRRHLAARREQVRAQARYASLSAYRKALRENNGAIPPGWSLVIYDEPVK